MSVATLAPASGVSARPWVTIIAFGSTQAFVNGVTTLLSLTNYSASYSDLYVVLDNEDPSNSVTLQVDVSHGGVRINDELQQTKLCGPQAERSIRLSAGNPDVYIRVQVNNAGSSVQGTWAIRGVLR